MQSQFNLDGLKVLGESFFNDILAIQLKQRQTALKTLQQNTSIKGFEHVCLPILDYICL